MLEDIADSACVDTICILAGDTGLDMESAEDAVALVQPINATWCTAWQVHTTARQRRGDLIFARGSLVEPLYIAVGASFQDQNRSDRAHDALGLEVSIRRSSDTGVEDGEATEREIVTNFYEIKMDVPDTETEAMEQDLLALSTLRHTPPLRGHTPSQQGDLSSGRRSTGSPSPSSKRRRTFERPPFSVFTDPSERDSTDKQSARAPPVHKRVHLVPYAARALGTGKDEEHSPITPPKRVGLGCSLAESKTVRAIKAGLEEELSRWWLSRPSQEWQHIAAVIKELDSVKSMLFRHLRHALPSDLWTEEETDDTGMPCVSCPASRTFILQRIRAVLETREEWLKKENLHSRTVLTGQQRHEFVAWCKEQFHNEPMQLELQERDRQTGNANQRYAAKKSRWGREMQQRLGAKQFWEVVSFTGRFDIDLLKQVDKLRTPPGQAEQDREQRRILRSERIKKKGEHRKARHLAARRENGQYKFAAWERRLLAAYDSGQLREEMNAATEAFGFGRIWQADGTWVRIGGVTRAVLGDGPEKEGAEEDDEE